MKSVEYSLVQTAIIDEKMVSANKHWAKARNRTASDGPRA